MIEGQVVLAFDGKHYAAVSKIHSKKIKIRYGEEVQTGSLAYKVVHKRLTKTYDPHGLMGGETQAGVRALKIEYSA